MKLISWRQAIPNLFTILAMLAGFIAILVTFEGIRSPIAERTSEMYRMAAQLIMLSMILDGLDGNLARLLKGQSDFGAELDTYVDLTAFGIAPAILIFASAMEHHNPIWRILLPSAVALSGMVRLARFKVKDPLRGHGGYAGLPITANAGWVAMFVFISRTPPAPGTVEDLYSLQHGWFALVFLGGVLLFVLLQVSNLRYPKPTKKAALFIPCIILVALLFMPGDRLSVRAAFVMILLGIGYIFIGPLFVKGVEVHRARKESRELGERDGSVLAEDAG